MEIQGYIEGGGQQGLCFRQLILFSNPRIPPQAPKGKDHHLLCQKQQSVKQQE